LLCAGGFTMTTTVAPLLCAGGYHDVCALLLQHGARADYEQVRTYQG